MSNSIFERHEVKYRISAPQRAALERALSTRMVPDAFGHSTIRNIYFDTPDYRLIRASLEKPAYKEKLRLRSYRQCDKDAPVFLELKKKFDGIVYKRRIRLPLDAAMAFLAGQAALPEDSQIGREIAYCRDFYQTLVPAVYLSYDRDAFFCKDDPALRMTFDQNISFRTAQVDLTREPGGCPILQRDESLLEIKVGASIPMWLVELLHALQIRQTSFSKYGRAYGMITKNEIDRKRSVSCA
ncbi:MAG: polyphosphate polymerase domain-containing protein [Oscillospiraceae bacterium]|nr:polyphosphate polymerase domain-containing protein [Oscillospiraceae bacterium]